MEPVFWLMQFGCTKTQRRLMRVKAHLKVKFECVCVTMCSLVMSLFSRDYIITLKQKFTNQSIITCLQVYSVPTAPGF